MSEADRKFHETWLGMVQPVEGLVVSIPVLVDAQCMERQAPEVQNKLALLCPPRGRGDAGPERYTIADLGKFLSELLGLTPELFDAGDAVPDEVSLYIPEGRQTLRPTLALRKQGGGGYELLVWELPRDGSGAPLDLDRSETVTGTWDYPPSAKLDRLLRHCRVPIGLLTNGESLRLMYAPHGESSGAITFRLDDMASVGGRPILDAFVMLLSANRFFGVSADRSLSALLDESRKRQANVTNDLADQVFEALAALLRGFEAAAERDGRALLSDALERGGDHLYKGLLTVLLRLVFILYAEDRGLLPVADPLYGSHLSVLALFEELQADRGAYPDSMSRRFGAWGRLVTVFRAIYLGVEHGPLKMCPRRGALFNPHEYPFLEGWGPAGSAPISTAEERAEVRLPTVDDETVYRVLEKLIVFEGQRLSYRALDVEQIGSVYEALMGYHVVASPHAAVCTRPNRLWMSVEEIEAIPPARRAKWIKETLGVSAKQAEALASDVSLEGLTKLAMGGKKADPSLAQAKPGQLVLQPGAERRRTSSHYTPRSLSAPIVQRTLEPLLAVMGEAPASERILSLKVCDPAMGSGAFLVEACRFLADRVVAAWTREARIEAIAAEHGDPLLHARRVVAQRCLYGVDKNDAAVELAKLSLWLVTLSKDLPFTFLDHALRHGDSLVGLDFNQIRSFHWKPDKQLEFASKELDAALAEAIGLRTEIGDLALGDDDAADQRAKERLLWDAQDALERVRLIGDLVVGAFFAKEKDKDREKERLRRQDLVKTWLAVGGPPPEELTEMRAEIRRQIPVFHWMLEFPEVFYAERPDPLEDGAVNSAAYMDAFVGNPPFMGVAFISEALGDLYGRWLYDVYPGTTGKFDLVASFFRRSASLLGAHGTIGLIATNTVAQGDTRLSGLAWLLDRGMIIYSATSRLPWSDGPNVAISVLHLAIGSAMQHTGRNSLDGVFVDCIDSRLRAGPERGEPSGLAANAELSFQGSLVLGTGFILTPGERQALVEKDPRNGERTYPILGGEEVNTSPTQTFDRYVINFGQLGLQQAECWPDLLQRVQERVKPERDKLRGNTEGSAWWQLWRPRAGLYAALTGLSRALVTARVSKHLVFSWQPTDRVFSDQLYVFPLQSFTAFAALQARSHEAWARLLSSTLEDRAATARIRYAASDCFENFPFPNHDPRTVIPALEDVGQRLYDFRAKYMVDENVGLTITYNRLKDPHWDEARILELRRLHEEMDREVLKAYGWDDLAVPPYCPLTPDDTQRLKAFEDEVIDRLFVLNAKRAEEETLRGVAKTPKGVGKTKVHKTSAKKKASENGENEQLELGAPTPNRGARNQGDPA